MSNKNKGLFRQEALQNLKVSSQLNKRLSIVSMPYWIIFFSIALIIVTIIFWGFLGSIPTRVPGNGILLAAQGGLYNAVSPEGNGRVISIAVKPGDVVKKNDIIAHLDNPDFEEKLQAANLFLTKLQTEYNKLKEQFALELREHTQQIEEQNSILNQSIASNTEKLNYFTSYLETKRTAFKKGLITQESIATTTQSVYETQTTIKQAQNSLGENQMKQSSFISQWKARLDVLKLKMFDQEYQVNDIKIKLTGAKEVKSPIAGVITFTQASIGEKLEGGEVVATIATLAKNLDAIIFVPAQNGKRIKTGMKALISPTFVKKEEFGSIKAEVVQVSLFPSTSKTMLSVLQNEDLVREFTKQGTVIAVRVHLKIDPSTYSGYTWTSSQGPRQFISAGTLVNALITVETHAPISLIIPAFKTLLGE